jgi:hypothetical protein
LPVAGRRFARARRLRRAAQGSRAMLIILCLYVVLLWLVFSKFKLVRLGWVSGAFAALGGALMSILVWVSSYTAYL